MTLHDYLLKNLNSVAMIGITIDNHNIIQYNYWNWFVEKGELHLLHDDLTIGHIIYSGSISLNDDGSITHQSKYNPKIVNMNFYFGGYAQ